MDPLATISGLATGIDFRDLVNQIIEAESSRLEPLRLSITESQEEVAAWEEVRGLLQALQDATTALEDGSGLDAFTTEILGLSPSLLRATASADAATGRHTVRVLQEAQREQLGSGLFASRSTALGVSGQFILGGRVVDVFAGDSLQDIAGGINTLNIGSDPTGVSATVTGSDGAYRLVLSATETGSAGIDVLDLSGVLGSLGLLDGTTTAKNRTSGGFQTDGFADTTTAVGTLLGFPGVTPSGTVTLGAGASSFTVALDLSTMSLEGVRDAINAAASGAGASMFASIVTDTSGGETTYRLDITGTPAATDDGAVLQSMGLLEGGRSAVSQVVQGDVLTTDAGGTPATAATRLTNLFNGGSDAGAQVGDTLTFQGTDHNGNAFALTHTIQGGDTLQTLITRLDGAEGFNGSATVEISATGQLTATSATAGASLLSLEVFAGNEGGGILDLGDMVVTDAGRDREISAGQDALVEIDGSLVTSASNEISDVVQGVTFSVLGADPSSPLEVVVGRDTEVGVASVQAFIDAYNAFSQFVGNGIDDLSENRPPLAGDSILRGVRSRITFALQSALPTAAATSFTRLSDLGVEITRDGVFTLDASTLQDALAQDAAGVERLFSAFGVGSSSAVSFLAAGSASAGTYDINVTQLGSSAVVTSVGFGGTYVDDGTADTLTIVDDETGTQYDIQLSNGMSLTDIIDAVNAELGAGQSQEITSEFTMYSNPPANAVADASTPLEDLRDGPGPDAGFVAGTEFTISGTTAEGTAVLETFSVTDPATETFGTLQAAVQSAFGAGTSVSIVNGQLVVEDTSVGESQLSVSIGSDVPGNPAPFGQMLVTQQGRAASSVVAEATGPELTIRDDGAGAGGGFTLSFSAGGGDGTGSLGLSAGAFVGSDVEGTINGEAATGVGNVLTADAGTSVEGLSVGIGGVNTGAIGSVTVGSGILTDVTDQLEELLRFGDGQIDGIIKRLDASVDRVEDRLEDREARLEDRRQRLIAQFVALEQAVARAQSIQEQLASQLATLPGGN
ncbi:MAG: flagellar filament capping protein FliD [Gemmatimonadetes bacterium]|nr:flagellar filament capping protein FliD [Gemmatimonadota bacterium]